MAEPKCPSCKKVVARPPGNKWFPFCDERCKVIDLGKWLSGDYRIPVSDDDDADPGVPPTDGGSGTLH